MQITSLSTAAVRKLVLWTIESSVERLHPKKLYLIARLLTKLRAIHVCFLTYLLVMYVTISRWIFVVLQFFGLFCWIHMELLDYSKPLPRADSHNSSKQAWICHLGSLFLMSSIHPELLWEVDVRSLCLDGFFFPWIDPVSAGISWCDSKGEISYVTAHMQTIRAQPCLKGAGRSSGNSGVLSGKTLGRPNRSLYPWQRRLCPLSSDLWAVLLAVEMFMQKCGSTQCVMKAINIQHVLEKGRRNKYVRERSYGKEERGWNEVQK